MLEIISIKKYTLSIVFIIVGAILYGYGYYLETVVNEPVPPVSHNYSWGRPYAASYPTPQSITLKHLGILFVLVGTIIAIYKIYK